MMSLELAVFGLLVIEGVRRSAVGAGVIGFTVADGDGGAILRPMASAMSRPTSTLRHSATAVDHPVMVRFLTCAAFAAITYEEARRCAHS